MISQNVQPFLHLSFCLFHKSLFLYLLPLCHLILFINIRFVGKACFVQVSNKFIQSLFPKILKPFFRSKHFYKCWTDRVIQFYEKCAKEICREFAISKSTQSPNLGTIVRTINRCCYIAAAFCHSSCFFGTISHSTSMLVSFSVTHSFSPK